MLFINGRIRDTKNKGAFGGKLLCPLCKSEKNKLIERLTPYRYRYQCGNCKRTFQYDVSGTGEHPFAPFKNKQLFKEILEGSKIRKS